MYYNFISDYIIFLIFSFGGYIMEVLICSFEQKHWVNRGFLFGPICPIYGVGCLLIVKGLSRYYDNPIIIFILGAIITAGVEYYTSYIFEKIFHNKWWDYSNRLDNLNGRICLGNCLGFGVGALLIIYLFYPLTKLLIGMFSPKFVEIFGTVSFILMIFDLIGSGIIAYNLRSRLIVAEELKHEKIKMIPALLERKYHDQLSKIKFKTNRLINVYPEMAHNLRKELDLVKKMLVDLSKKKKK
jgi:uncharacterized membrane protein